MFAEVKKFFSAFQIPSRQELELAYLNGAVSRADLEFRQRQVERGMFRDRYSM